MTEYDDRTIARFWSKVARGGADQCWPWTAMRDGNGYGRFRVRNPRRLVRAHVFSYQVERGRTHGLMVCHSCDNPGCCNPAHLWLGKNADNMADMVRKGRQARRDTSGEKNGNAKLTAEQVATIRSQIGAGDNNTVIAARFGVTHSMISRIRLGLSWALPSAVPG